MTEKENKKIKEYIEISNEHLNMEFRCLENHIEKKADGKKILDVVYNVIKIQAKINNSKMWLGVLNKKTEGEKNDR